MGCNLFDTGKDSQMIEDSLAGGNSDLDPEILEEIKPEVEKEVERCLEEKAENAKELLNERLNEKIERENYTPTNLEKLDLELWPTEKEHKAMYEAGKTLRMSDVEIVLTPVIVGTKDVENMEEKIKDVMTALNNSKILPEFREEYRVNKIMFIDQERENIEIKPRERASVFKPEVFEEKLELPRTIHIFKGTNGEFPKGKELQRFLAHEIFHINEPIFETQIIAYHPEEWKKACDSQITKGPVSNYSIHDYKEANILDSIDTSREFMADHFSYWVIDSPVICSEMETFFDKYFAK